MLRGNPPIGTALRDLRLSAHLSQREAAAEVGCSVRAWQGWEAGAMPQYRYRRALLTFVAKVEKAAA
jgi:transcriptional regulator with XRE-family HTH domain